MTERLFKIYKKTISPILVRFFGEGCRYTPTCSQYARQAIGKYGIVKGSFLAGKRFFSCHPFSSRDYFDPVR